MGCRWLTVIGLVGLFALSGCGRGGRSEKLSGADESQGTSISPELVPPGARTAVPDLHEEGQPAEAPLHKASREGDVDGAERLIAAGADVDARNAFGYAPLHEAARKGHKQVVELLIAQGAAVNARHEGGETPLHHCAAGEGDASVAAMLISAGADVNAATDQREFLHERIGGSTPLHWAVAGGHRELVEVLIAGGADVNARTAKGTTPLRVATREDYDEIARLLEEHSAKE